MLISLGRYLNAFAAFLGLSYVACSAYVSHQTQLSSSAQSSIEHALTMHIVHVLLMLVVGLNRWQDTNLWGSLAQIFAALGVLLFSFTIYAKYLFNIALWSKLTMYGGFSLLFAWVILLIYVLRLTPFTRPQP